MHPVVRGMMRKAAPPPVRAIALLLVGLLPLQVGLSGLLGAATRGHDHAAGNDHAAHGQVAHGPIAGGDTEVEGDAHAAHEPCGETGLCDTGLMTCSDAAPCATAVFAPSAPDLPALWMGTASASPVAASVLTDAPFPADTPPPRA